MKKLFIAAALCLSGSAFAYTCEVDMLETRTNRILTTIRVSEDYDDSCRKAMKACRLEIRKRGLLDRADCIRRIITNPRPHPDYNPNPSGQVESRRPLRNGEKAIYDNKFVIVVARSMNGLYTVRSMDVWNTVSHNIRRENISITNGCNLDICTNDSVINIRTGQYLNVVGLSFHNSFVTQTNDIWSTLSSNVDRGGLALTSGCINSYYSQVCVGQQVVDRINRYSTVAGIQLDGRIVLKSLDVWNTLTPNVDPTQLVITR
jgi:hypothetical protein